jgi:hypothetical protein
MVIFQIDAQRKPSRIEKESFSNIKEVYFEHSYGNITVIESDSQQVELEIQYFDREDQKPVCKISATTVLKIKTMMPNNWTFYNNNDTKKLGIDYIIAVPRDVAMNVDLKYCNVVMNDFYGDFIGNMSYSNLTANTFHKSPVNISAKYSNIKLEQVDDLNTAIAYSNLDVATIDNLILQTKYGKSQIGKVKNMRINCSYGTVNIDSVVELDAELRYTPTNIGNLDKKLTMKCSYSNTNINNTSKRLETVKFDGNYSGFKLGLNENLSADISIDLKYGNLSVSDKYKPKYVFSKTDYGRSVSKKGTIGDKTPTAKIEISNSYANVSIR